MNRFQDRTKFDSSKSGRFFQALFGVSSGVIIFLILGAIWSINYNETNALRFSKVDVKDSGFNKKSYLEMADRVFSQPFMSPTYKYNIAFTLLENGHISESVADFKKILIVDPRNLYANTALAIVYEHFNGRLQAIEYRKKIQSLDPYNAPSLVELENDYILTDNRALAVTTRDSILAMAPGTDIAKRAQSLLPK
jgi:tetratricopeptide (TPR) repeat protein